MVPESLVFNSAAAVDAAESFSRASSHGIPRLHNMQKCGGVVL